MVGGQFRVLIGFAMEWFFREQQVFPLFRDPPPDLPSRMTVNRCRALRTKAIQNPVFHPPALGLVMAAAVAAAQAANPVI